MRPVSNIYLYNDDVKFFGEGPCRLLHQVEETGSLRSAAASMELSYSKALAMIKRAEEALGFALTEKTVGGKGGGGSKLTSDAKEFIKKYEQYRAACVAANAEIFRDIFCKKKVACVVMASGLSKRFGDNKLLAEVNDRTFIDLALDITDGELFDERIVLTRSPKVKEICDVRSAKCVFHDLPGRNDAIKLALETLEQIDAVDDKPWKDDCSNSFDAVLFCPCDQPMLRHESLENIVEAFLEDSESVNFDGGIYRLASGGEQGAPVLFTRKYFEELKSLPEKKGGSVVIENHREDVNLIEAVNELELYDIDTKDDLFQLKFVLEAEKE